MGLGLGLGFNPKPNPTPTPTPTPTPNSSQAGLRTISMSELLRRGVRPSAVVQLPEIEASRRDRGGSGEIVGGRGRSREIGCELRGDYARSRGVAQGMRVTSWSRSSADPRMGMPMLGRMRPRPLVNEHRRVARESPVTSFFGVWPGLSLAIFSLASRG